MLKIKRDIFMCIFKKKKNIDTSNVIPMTKVKVVEIKKDITTPIEGYHILIVEDILDTGVTLSNVLPLLLQKGAKSVKIATLLNKPERRRCEVKLDYQGAEIPDKFVVGYGLDYNEEYRNLPFVGILKPSVYEK